MGFLYRRLLRPLLVLLTLGALVVASFEVVGRVTFVLLEQFEPAINRYLAARDVRLHGLSGDWRRLNPVVHVDRVELPAGHLVGFTVELDMIESVLRGSWLARRLEVDDARLRLEKSAGEPWRLAGGALPSGELDPRRFVAHSDQLDVAGVATLARDGVEPAEIAFDYLGLNRDGRHRHRLGLRNRGGACEAGCELGVDLQVEPALWPFRQPERHVRVKGTGFVLPEALLGPSALRLADLRLRWDQARGESAGTLQLAAEQFALPGDAPLATRLEGAVRGDGDRHRGAVREWHMRSGEARWRLPDMAVSADPEGVSLWMPSLDLTRAAEFLQRALAGVGPARRWLAHLDVRGRAHNLRAFHRFGGGTGYALTLDGLALDGYKGVPTVHNAGGELFGYGQGLQLNLNSQDMQVAFPNVFDGRWEVPYAQGIVQLWFERGYFGVRGLNVRADALGSRMAANFAVSRPLERTGQRLALLLDADRVPVARARDFLPRKMPARLRNWLESGPRDGTLLAPRMAYQGQFRERPGELGRRLELAAEVRDARVRYHPEWPEVAGLAGSLAIAGSVVDVALTGGRSGGVDLGGSRVHVRNGVAEVALDAAGDAGDALAFLRASPLADTLAFVRPDWQARGPLRVSGELRVPFGSAERRPEVRLRSEFEGVDLDLPGYRLALADLDGRFRYRYPHELNASGISGRLFGEPVTIGAHSAEDRVHLYLDGRARPEDVWAMLDLPDSKLAQGSFAYEADLGIAVGDTASTELLVSSRLDGVALELPGGYGKPASRDEPLTARVRFLPDHRELRMAFRDIRAWLHVDEELQKGAVGFGADPAGEAEVGEELVLTGRVGDVALGDVLPAGDAADGGAGAPPLPLRLDAVEAESIALGEHVLNAAVVDGEVTADGFDVGFTSAEASGLVRRQGGAPLQVSLETLNVPPGRMNDGADAALAPDVIAPLPVADVRIERFTVGAEDYGSWQFRMRPDGTDLHLRELKADVRGVAIDAPEGLTWRGGENLTRFQGELSVADLADVLPRWGYAPNVETESASLQGEFEWSGSPAAVDLLALRGRGRIRSENGRFLDVESGSGALRIVSLLNFTAIAKRMSLNFSDVFGRGVSFEEIDGVVALDEGDLQLVEPVRVSGTGSSFRLTGSVDLRNQRLRNEMLVTLPVSRGVPWYAAYVALANPLAGLSVLVGERVLRKPLEQFSSANYRIGGTLDDPDVELISVFDLGSPDSPAALDVDASAPQDQERTEQQSLPNAEQQGEERDE
ncbi:MAG: YhdP family protein [Pseudomonadota bacterium]